MIKFTINSKTTHLPLKTVKGNIKRRSQKVDQMNKKFFEDVKGIFTYGDASSNVCSQIIQKNIPSNIHLQINRDEGSIGSKLALNINKKNTFEGYILSIPTTPRENKIKLIYFGKIMTSMHELLERIVNPKYNTRGIKFINNILRKYPTINKDLNFIYSSKTLTEADLNKYLTKLEPNEQIDMLQLMRYNLKIRLNSIKAGNKYQKELEKLHKHKGMAKSTPVDTNRLQLLEKIQIIEDKLAKTIKEERSKIANS